MGCTTTSVTTEVSPGALLLRAIAAAAEEGADLLDRRSAGEHPYVVGWARAAAMVIILFFAMVRVREKRERTRRGEDRQSPRRHLKPTHEEGSQDKKNLCRRRRKNHQVESAYKDPMLKKEAAASPQLNNAHSETPYCLQNLHYIK